MTGSELDIADAKAATEEADGRIAADANIRRKRAALRRIEAGERRRLASKLDHVLRDHGFALRYVPRLTLGTEPSGDFLCGAELIIGIVHRRRGVVPLEMYLRELNRPNTVAAIIAEALAEAAAEKEAHWPPGWTIDLAITPRLGDLSALRAAISGIPATRPGRFTLAIDEAALIETGLDALSAIEELHADGFNIALAQFGGRYGSLSLLRELPISGLKLDRALLGEDGRPHSADLVLLEASIAIGRDRGLTVIADGVETERQAALVRGLQVNAAQGPWIGPAMTASSLARILPVKFHR